MKFLIVFQLLLWIACLPTSALTQIKHPRFHSTYLGGQEHDQCEALVLDSDRSVLITGSTSSQNFPVTPGPLGATPMGYADLYLSRLDETMTRLIASVRIGGSSNDRARLLAVDRNGDLVLAGQTDSLDFPFTAKAYHCPNRGKGDLFIMKIDRAMTQVIAAACLGGTGSDSCQGLALDKEGNIYLSGTTGSADFPTTEGAFDETFNTGDFMGDYQGNIFIAKLSGDLSELLAATYLGGTGGEVMGTLALDSLGHIFVTGSTRSSDFPISDQAFDRSFNGAVGSKAGDVYITKLNADLSGLLASTYLGGPGFDWGYSLALDRQDQVYVTGHAGPGFPVTRGAFDRTFNDPQPENWGSDSYVAKLNSDLTDLLAGTYLGGPGEDIGTQVVPIDRNRVYVYGVTRTAGFPTLPGALQPRFDPDNGDYQGDLFITLLKDDLTSLIEATLFGGAGNEFGSRCLAQGSSGGIVAAVSTSTPDLHTPATAYNPTSNGKTDLYLLKVTGSLCQTMPDDQLIENPIQLTQHTAWDYHPHWSADGKFISFTSQRGGEPGLWMKAANGSCTEEIPIGLTGDLYNEWLPDGSGIVFDARQNDDHLDVFVYFFATQQVQKITQYAGMDNAPSVSPDGSAVTFVSLRSGNADIWTQPVAGVQTKRITFYNGSDWHPRWSDDGTKILYTSDRSGNPEIWYSPIGGGAATQVTHHPGKDDRADWSPDSTLLAVTSDRSGNEDIWIVPVSGGQPVQVTHHPARDTMPCWSPDGTRLAFCSDRGGNLDIWILRLPKDLRDRLQ